SRIASPRSAFRMSSIANTAPGWNTTRRMVSMHAGSALASCARSRARHEGRAPARLVHVARWRAPDRAAAHRDRAHGGGGRLPLALGHGPLLPDPAVGQTRGPSDARGVLDARLSRGGDHAHPS